MRIAMSFDESEEEFDGGSDLGRKVVVPLIASLQEELMKKLDAMTIEDVCRQARSLSLGPGAVEKRDADFTI